MEPENKKSVTSLTSSQPKSLETKQVSKIFQTMKAIYGQKFMASFHSTEDIQQAQAVWARALWFLDDHQVTKGLKKCAYLEDWNPNIPELIRLATGLPRKEETVARVLSGDTEDEVSWRIRKKIGSWDIGHQTQSVIRTRVLGLYPEVYMEVIEEMEGEDNA